MKDVLLWLWQLIMKKVLLFLWQLPQNIIGLLVILFTRARKQWLVYHTDKCCFGVSLGWYIIFGGYYTTTDIKHEQGHQQQSLYLGPLYLILIGIPSLIGNLIDRIFYMGSKWYYKQPWEAWADKLGGVVRE